MPGGADGTKKEAVVSGGGVGYLKRHGERLEEEKAKRVELCERGEEGREVLMSPGGEGGDGGGGGGGRRCD